MSFFLIYLNNHYLFIIKDKKTHLDSNSTAQYLSNDTKHDISWKYPSKTFDGNFFRVPPNSVLFGGTVPPNNTLFGGTLKKFQSKVLDGYFQDISCLVSLERYWAVEC